MTKLAFYETNFFDHLWMQNFLRVKRIIWRPIILDYLRSCVLQRCSASGRAAAAIEQRARVFCCKPSPPSSCSPGCATGKLRTVHWPQDDLEAVGSPYASIVNHAYRVSRNVLEQLGRFVPWVKTNTYYVTIQHRYGKASSNIEIFIKQFIFIVIYTYSSIIYIYI